MTLGGDLRTDFEAINSPEFRSAWRFNRGLRASINHRKRLVALDLEESHVLSGRRIIRH